MTDHSIQKCEWIRSQSPQETMLRSEFLIQSNIFKNLTWEEEKYNLCVYLVNPYLGAWYSDTRILWSSNIPGLGLFGLFFTRFYLAIPSFFFRVGNIAYHDLSDTWMELVAGPGAKPFLHSPFLDMRSCSVKPITSLLPQTAFCCKLGWFGFCLFNLTSYHSHRRALVVFSQNTTILAQPQAGTLHPGPGWGRSSVNIPVHTLSLQDVTVTEDMRKTPEELQIYLRC